MALVWSVLIDFDRYEKWNAFCPVCETTLELGSPVKMQVDLGFGMQEQVEYLCRVDAEEALAWQMENKPGDPIHAVRTQYLQKLDENRCTYVSIDEFSGSAVKDMLELMAAPIERGFNLCAYGLKDYSETLFRAVES